MLDYTSVPVPLRIIGIQQRTTLDKAHETLGEMWRQWEGDHKANRLPSFTMTIYCVYQYFDDAPNDVLITIGRITATDFPLPSLQESREYLAAQLVTLPWEGLALSRDEPALATRFIGF